MMSSSAIIAFTGGTCALALGAAAAAKSDRSVSRWAFAAGMAILAAESILAGLGAAADTPELVRMWQGWRHLVLSLVPPAWVLFSCTYSRPAGWRVLKHNRVVLAAAAAVPLLFFPWHTAALGPLREDRALQFGTSGLLLYAAVLVSAVAILMNLERTFRASVGTVRWRIKYMLLGVGVLFAVRIYTTSQALVFRSTTASLDLLDAGALIVAMPLLLRSFLRAGHFEMDVYPSGNVLRNSLTVLLAGVYLVLVGVLAKAVEFLGGDAAFSLKALLILVALVGLTLVLQSDRARLRARYFVSRHFERPLHDYPAIWSRVTGATASCIEEKELCRCVSTLVADVFQALSVRMWLLNERRDTLVLVASTASNSASETCVSLTAAPLIAYFGRKPHSVNFDRLDEVWCGQVRQGHPTDFPNGGDRYCAPLFGRGELLGIVTLGDRVGGIPLSAQDTELLKCISDHASACLLNVHLSQRLLQAKQLEAFQSMAAFFVHDLKNAASTLNLMLKNLPVHFDDPEFRADALRGIGKTVEHIDGLIHRLSALRHELKVVPVDSDLNEIVSHVLKGLRSLPESKLVNDIHPVPRIPIDRDQVHKVITNIVLNAAEATTPNGRVSITTGQENGWVVLTVDDDGCGMSEQFLTQSLFRPFQTTKKNGLGIGMYQSKMIVEAHGGRIAVSSRPGCGTRFQVYLPVPGKSA